ncbi:MAG: hypothetical protein ACKO96_35965, partial [Flammeovirgaceae bacterium]
KVSCNSVTTTWLGNYGYSYLSTYANDSNYFFLSRDKEGFTIREWSEEKTLYKISKEKTIQFINDFSCCRNFGAPLQRSCLIRDCYGVQRSLAPRLIC